MPTGVLACLLLPLRYYGNASEISTIPGAVGDGLADDSAALQNALDRSSALRLPQLVFRVTRPLILRGGHSLSGGGAKILLDGGKHAAAGIVCADNVAIEGLSFAADERYRGSAIAVPGASLTNPGGTQTVFVRNCDFTFKNDGATGVQGNQGTRGIVVRDCQQSGGQSLFFGIGVESCEVLHNSCTDVQRPIVFYGGRRSRVSDNYLNGGIVGILLISFRGQGPTGNLTYDNMISGNHLKDQSEEGIGLDCRCNVQLHWPENPVAPLVSVISAKRIGMDSTEMQIRETTHQPGWADGYWIVGLDDDTGPVGVVERSGLGSLSARWNSIGELHQPKTKDRFVVTSGFFRNSIVDNTLSNAGTCAISLWGSSWHTEIARNEIVTGGSGICVTSVVTPSAKQAQAISGWNIIAENRVEIVPGKSEQPHLGFPIYVGSRQYGGRLLPFSTFHNQILGNSTFAKRPVLVEDAVSTVIENNNFSSAGSLTLRDTNSTRVRKNLAGNRLAPLELHGRNIGIEQ